MNFFNKVNSSIFLLGIDLVSPKKHRYIDPRNELLIEKNLRNDNYVFQYFGKSKKVFNF